MMVYAYVHRITEFGENEPSVQKSVFKRLRVEHCSNLMEFCIRRLYIVDRDFQALF